MASYPPSQDDIKLRTLSLVFSGEQSALEEPYANYYFDKNLKHLRYSHYMAVVFYLLSAIIDYVIFPSLFRTFALIRISVVAPCFLAGVMITYLPIYRKIWRQQSFFYILITGISFIVMMMMAPAPDGYTYYIGVIVSMIFGYNFIREPFLWASVAGCILLGGYFLAGIAIQMPGTKLMMYGFYIAVVNGLGMLIAYAFEVQSRIDFFLSHLLNLEKQKVNELAMGLEEEVQMRTRDLISTNENLKREISERETIEHALRNSEKRYRSLQSNIPIGLYRIVEGKVMSANPAMSSIFKAKDEKALLNRSVADYFCNADDLDALLMELREGGNITNAEVELRALNGDPFWGLLNVARVFIGDRSSFCYDGTLEDITVRKAAAEDKEKMARQLRQAHKMESLGTLAGGVAHDFNNILTVALGFTDLVLEDIEKGTLAEKNLMEVRNAGERAKDLVRQILTFARRSDESLSPVEVGRIAEETLRFLRSSLPTTIGISSRISSKALVMGNETQIHQILMNLGTNAAHAMEDQGGVISIRITDAEHPSGDVEPDRHARHCHYVEISVSDTGRGIPSDIIGSIFDPYFTTKALGKGTGMGLAVVHGIVESYGGSINVSSKIGQGTVITISLPATAQNADLIQENGADMPGGNENILVVDDEPAIADMIGQLLRRLGYRTTTLNSSDLALANFRRKPGDYDLVISDMTMPSLTGKDLAARMLLVRPGLPIILLTGYSPLIDEAAAASMGIQALIQKPVTAQRLASMVRAALDGNKGGSNAS